MRIIPIAIIVVFLLGIGSAKLFSFVPSESNSQSDVELPPEENNDTLIPEFLSDYIDSNTYSEIICTANGKTYYYSNDNSERLRAVYTLDELLCGDPTLLIDSIDSLSKTTFSISTAHKSMIVDFADKNSVEKLKSLVPKFSYTNRFCKNYYAKENRILYHFEVDYPKQNTHNDDNIRKWLLGIINKTFDDFDYSEYDMTATKHDKKEPMFWKYKGNVRDIKAIGKFMSDKYIAIKINEYGDDDDAYPCMVFFNLSLRLVSSNGKYYSYQKCMRNYNGGAHSYYTENIVSFDPVRNEEIDWNYLFVPGSKEKVLDLFFNVVKNNAQYVHWKDISTAEMVRDDFKQKFADPKTGDITLTKPGLTDTGVVFSYQPYEIECFAAGCFHFEIPYKDLMPYLTTKAKQILELTTSHTH